MSELNDESKASLVRKRHSPEKERLVKKIIGEREEEGKIEKTKSKRWQFVIEVLLSITAIILTWFLSKR